MNSIIDEITADICTKSKQIMGIGQLNIQGIPNVNPKVTYSGRVAAEEHTIKHYGTNAAIIQAWGVFPDNLTGHSMNEVVNHPQLSRMVFSTWDNRPQRPNPDTIIVDVKKSYNGKYSYIITK